uniref:Ig-like domain-containing protein n=1 Tax=Oreochromis niloticus TaxID=8128 RepID=A0A669CWU2_ORENI
MSKCNCRYTDCISLLCFFLFPGLTAGDSITPQQAEVTETEGESVKLTCSYETTDSDVWLFWYKHHSDLEAPQFILYKGFIHEREKKEFHLEISSAAVTDSAVYYCALQPTVTGNTKTLYKNLWTFGGGGYGQTPSK